MRLAASGLDLPFSFGVVPMDRFELRFQLDDDLCRAARREHVRRGHLRGRPALRAAAGGVHPPARRRRPDGRVGDVPALRGGAARLSDVRDWAPRTYGWPRDLTSGRWPGWEATMGVATLVSDALGGRLPFRVEAYDASAAGPRDAALCVRIVRKTRCAAC